MVKEYQKPEFKTVTFEKEDVITTSNSYCGTTNPLYDGCDNTDR
ncbi:hypothetical protein EDC44_11410 [Cricetibacter osteomyelitidis]|uniref:Uncharacterized protein n=1 Tax=Cricetibacter osteomyelitidis TaxID=1521931 RepID=A0A4R2SWB7_9PAST|nr:hypothetical protein [Cricetibacter osteomyelitidis]TCP94767.1 hypothetical protein EDC44_11410 [Cricetibacter osteomyelitidis]